MSADAQAAGRGNQMSDGRPFIPLWMGETGLAPSQLALLTVIWSRADSNGDSFAAIKTLGADCSFRDVKTTRSALKELVRRGFLKRTRRDGTTDLYSVVVPLYGTPIQM